MHPGCFSPHTYPQINYTTADRQLATVRIQHSTKSKRLPGDICISGMFREFRAYFA